MRRAERWAPIVFGLAALALWQGLVIGLRVPPYVLPGPAAIVIAFWADRASLLLSLVSTLAVTGAALLAAALLGMALAMAMAASRLARAAIQPWAVVLQ
ncbi:MAG: ABC transporter permease, partial [Acidiphilium sp. 37-67-22]